MQHALPLILLTLLLAAPGQAQDTRYVSDQIFVVLHKGPGTEFRWLARLTPGTRLSLSRVSEDGLWAEVTTDRGTTGWISSEHLSTETPAQLQVPQLRQRADSLAAKNAELAGELERLREENTGLSNQLTSSGSELGSVAEELAQLKQISGKAVQLDTENRRLVVKSETMHSEVEMLEAEKQRLQDKLDNEDFINGALAVLLGVLITLVVPRLWPKRRRNSEWA